MHLKPGHGQAQHAHAQNGHGGDLGPQEDQAGALEKNSLGDKIIGKSEEGNNYE
jgi:hypothetical protein